MSESQRNLLILLAIAVVGTLFVTQFSTGIGALFTVVNIAFVLVMGWWLYHLYRQNRGTISLMDPKWRLMLLASGILLFCVYLTGTLFPAWSNRGAAASVLFFVLLAACGFCMYYAWSKRSWRW